MVEKQIGIFVSRFKYKMSLFKSIATAVFHTKKWISDLAKKRPFFFLAKSETQSRLI